MFWHLNCVSYLDVVCGTWGEVSEQDLWYVQVLSHLCEGGVGIRTHLLVPTGGNHHHHHLPNQEHNVANWGTPRRFTYYLNDYLSTILRHSSRTCIEYLHFMLPPLHIRRKFCTTSFSSKCGFTNLIHWKKLILSGLFTVELRHQNIISLQLYVLYYIWIKKKKSYRIFFWFQ